MQTSHPQNQKLARWHFALAGIVAFVGSLPMFQVAMGILLLLGVVRPQSATADLAGDLELARASGSLMIVHAGVIVVLCWTLSLLILTAGKHLAADRRDGFCRVVAWLECLAVPLGTILGVVTLRTLARETRQSA